MKLSHYLYCLKRAAEAVSISMKNSSSTQLRKTTRDGFDVMNRDDHFSINFPESGSSVDSSKSDSDYSTPNSSGYVSEHAHSPHDVIHSHDSFHAAEHGHTFDASPSDSCHSSGAFD